VTRSLSSISPAWATTSIGLGRWFSVLMAKNSLFLWDQQRMFRLSRILAVPQF